MINHSKSLFLSLFIHLSIFIAILFLYSTILPKSQQIQEKRICVSLQAIKKECPVKNKKILVKKTPSTIAPIKEKKVPKKHKKHKKHAIVKKKIKKVVKVKKMEPKVEYKPIVQKQEEVTKEVTKEVVEVSKENIKQEIKAVSTKKCKTISKEKTYINNNLNEISSLIKENLYYPRRARKRGVQGVILVKFFLHKDATVSNVKILSSSSEILSRAAIKTITELSGKFPKPEEELTLKVPINYTLH